MKVLLLGSSGYLGKLLTNLLPSNIELLSPRKDELNLYNPNDLKKFLDSISSLDCIINCAVHQKTGDHLVKNGLQIYRDNMLINSSIANAIFLSKYPFQFITIGASCAYSHYAGKANYFTGDIHDSVRYFAYPKRNLAQTLSLYESKLKSWTVLVPGTLVGPGEQLNTSKKHFFNGTIYRAAKYSSKKLSTFGVFGDMDAVRDLSVADEVVKKIIELVNCPVNGIVNIDADYRIKVGQLYEIINDSIVNIDKFEYQKTKFKAQKEKSSPIKVLNDFSKESSINDKKFINLIERTYQYYMDSINNAL